VNHRQIRSCILRRLAGVELQNAAFTRPHATEHILKSFSLIEKLIQRGIAYKAADGSFISARKNTVSCRCTYGQYAQIEL